MKKSTLSYVLILCLCLISLTVSAAGPSTDDGKDEIPFSNDAIPDGGYGYNEFDMMKENEAAAANVPTGYSGYVLKIAKGGAVGFMLNMNSQKIKISEIESINFRVWCPANVKEVRIRHSNDWVMRFVPTNFQEWIDVSLTYKGDNFNGAYTMSVFDDGNGYLAPFNLGFRFTDSVYTAVYIDSVSVVMKGLDTTPPVFDYTGNTVINTRAGKRFVPDVTAFDEYENRSSEVRVLWSAGALDQNGLLLEGEHTCTLQASDLAGNQAELVLTVKVIAKDVTAPTISPLPERIHAHTGSLIMLDVTATDDVDDVEPILIWSAGAFDTYGQLVAGEHTLTITATDMTGNQTQKVIPVTVTESVAITGTLICDTQ